MSFGSEKFAMKTTMPLNACFGRLFQLSEEPRNVLVAAVIGNNLSSFPTRLNNSEGLGREKEGFG